ncbi:hypothetical protein DFH07DRAFT_1064034 [Mycena maculata]|uniref:Uncharacterized protein n=1 Tax=Mycena maculata TaxID=230809 RepID=A0AAD7IEY0_9AGAR|nr:hypothetical protein DFH07DRAFT_1064034 [Mycena maculata]
MPVLPAEPPAVPAFLPSPLFGVGLFVGVAFGATAVYVVSRYVSAERARRRARVADAETAGDASSTLVNVKAKVRGEMCADALAAARVTLQQAQIATVTKAGLVSLHKTLMGANTGITKTKPPVDAAIPATRAFIVRHTSDPARSPFHARRICALAGPSPLREVYLAPMPATRAFLKRYTSQPARSPFAPRLVRALAGPSPLRESYTALEPACASAPAPVAIAVVPQPVISVSILSGTSVALLADTCASATLAPIRPTASEDNCDSHGSIYPCSESEPESDIELEFKYDAVRKVWAAATPRPSPRSRRPAPPRAAAVCPSQPSPSHTPSPSRPRTATILARLQQSTPIRGQVLADTQTVNLRRAARVAKTPTRASRSKAKAASGGTGRGDKENALQRPMKL